MVVTSRARVLGLILAIMAGGGVLAVGGLLARRDASPAIPIAGRPALPTGASRLPASPTASPIPTGRLAPLPPTPDLGIQLWFSPTGTTRDAEPGAWLHIELALAAPPPTATPFGPLPAIALELRDSADRPAIFGPGPAAAQTLWASDRAGIWYRDLGAPTEPGTYHAQLSFRVGTAPTQTVSLPAPLLVVRPPPTPLRSGFVYDWQGNLWLTAADGLRTRQLTFYPSGEQATSPAWAPDGQQIAYVHRLWADATAAEPHTEINSIRPDGTGSRVLVARQPGEDLRDPAWAPDGRHLLVSVQRLIDPTTGGTPTSDQDLGALPSWGVEEVDLATGARQVLVRDALMPDLSPDGQHLVYVASVPAASDRPLLLRTLMLAGAAGQGARPLLASANFLDLATPRFSPDGRAVVFVATGVEGHALPPGRGPGLAALAHPFAPPWDVYLADVAHGTVRRLTQLRADGPVAAWGRDATRLALIADLGLFRVPLDGGDPQRLAPGASHSSLSWWDPP